MSSVSQAPPPRRAPRFWLRIVLLFAFILAAPFGWFLVGRIRVEWRLRSAWAEADRLDPGWRYDELEAKRGPLPDAENGALPVLEAMRHFPKGVYEPQWNAIALPPDISNEARAEWRWRLEQDLIELPANVSLNGQQETALLGELAQWQAALEPARRVRHYSTARFNYTLKDGWRMRADIGDSRSVGKLLRSDVLLQVHRRQWAAAVDSTRAALALGRIHADEPVHFPQLLRHVDYANAGNLIDRLLGQGEPPPPLLSELRNDLRIDSAQPFLRWIVRAFRDDIENTVARLNEGPLTDAAVKEHMELLEPRSRDKIQTKPSGNSWLERWRERAERDWKLRHAELVESANQWTIVVELPIGEQYEAFKRRKQGDVIFLESLIHSAVERALHTHAMLRALDAGPPSNATAKSTAAGRRGSMS